MSDKPVEVGRIEAIFRYPVKSMRGEALETAALGWHGVEGDRRFAFKRREAKGGFPWLTARHVAALLGYTPVQRGDAVLSTHVRTPEGEELELFGEALQADMERRHGHPVEMMQLNQGVFDEAGVSLITPGTVAEVCGRGGVAPDVRRFRPNILVRAARGLAFEEDGWAGGMLSFGDGADAPAIHVTKRDARCVMINLDPDGGPASPAVMKAAVAANGGNAGVYATVTRAGRLAVGQSVRLHRLAAPAGAEPALQETK